MNQSMNLPRASFTLGTPTVYRLPPPSSRIPSPLRSQVATGTPRSRDTAPPPAVQTGETPELSFADVPPASTLRFHDVEEPATGSCQVTACSPAGTLTCGGGVAGSNDGAGSTARVLTYPTCGIFDA